MNKPETSTALTADYEHWLGAQIPLDASDLAAKHEELRTHEYRFLRGTYYLWLVRVAQTCPDVLTRAQVPCVGDLHVENFGTWRDHRQVRRWGVNDLDELARGSWLLDLLRLATSAVLTPHLALDSKAIAEEVLTAWAQATPQPALDLGAKEAASLRRLVPEFADPAKFYAALTKGEPASPPPEEVVSAALSVAEAGWAPTWHHHEAGTGSLGHARVVGVGPAVDGTPHAREAKQLGPGACVWAGGRVSGMPTTEESLYDHVQTAVAGPAGAARVAGWQVRDLAPDVVRVDLTGLDHAHDSVVLRSMAAAAADVHGVDAPAHATAVHEASALSVHDFHAWVHAMAEVTRADFKAFAER